MKKCAATIGFFDGVHRGHLSLIAQLRMLAQRVCASSLVLTMDRHPLQVLQPDYKPRLLCSLERKVELLHNAGVDRVEVLHFTPEMASLSAQVFMRRVLKGEMGVTHLLMGYDHSFGCGGGTQEEYAAWGDACGIMVERAVRLSGEEVSSSMIRSLLEKGDVVHARTLLGRPYELRGNVISGHQVGRTLGFPTANLSLSEPLQIPAEGVYAVRVLMPDGRLCSGMLNVGHRPTLQNGDDVSIEVNIFDFIGEIYGAQLTIQFVAHLRGEHRFSSIDDLKKQIERDRKEVVRILARTSTIDTE